MRQPRRLRRYHQVMDDKNLSGRDSADAIYLAKILEELKGLRKEIQGLRERLSDVESNTAPLEPTLKELIRVVEAAPLN
jgi:hypothetical protein